jgi:hypothetical protein
VLITAALSCGIVYLEITTDPVELWASPSSRSRLEKEYYDENFEPFYRTEQIIITSKLDPFTYYPSNNDRDPPEVFGPIFQKEFMYAVLDLQERIYNDVSLFVDLKWFWIKPKIYRLQELMAKNFRTFASVLLLQKTQIAQYSAISNTGKVIPEILRP